MFHAGNQQTKASMWSPEPVLTPENRVWRAVLTQAFEDAEMAPIDDQTGAEPLEAPRARRYLRADSPFEAENLKLVCDFAELPADRVFLWARQRYPAEQMIENQVKCSGACPERSRRLPPLFLPPRFSLSLAFFGGGRKSEQGSRTPKIAASPQSQVTA